MEYDVVPENDAKTFSMTQRKIKIKETFVYVAESSSKKILTLRY